MSTMLSMVRTSRSLFRSQLVGFPVLTPCATISRPFSNLGIFPVSRPPPLSFRASKASTVNLFRGLPQCRSLQTTTPFSSTPTQTEDQKSKRTLIYQATSKSTTLFNIFSVGSLVQLGTCVGSSILLFWNSSSYADHSPWVMKGTAVFLAAFGCLSAAGISSFVQRHVAPSPFSPPIILLIMCLFLFYLDQQDRAV